MNTSPLFEMMRKSQEAQAVRLGINVKRRYSDEDLASSMRLLEQTEQQLYGGTMPDVPALIERIATQRAFRVTLTTTEGKREQISVLAVDSISALILFAEMQRELFGENKPLAFKIMVEPIVQRAGE